MLMLDLGKCISAFGNHFSAEASLQALKGLNDKKVLDDFDKTQRQKPGQRNTPRLRYIMPTVDNFRRTKKGRRLVTQCQKLIELQLKSFPAKSLLDVDGEVLKFSHGGKPGEIAKNEFLDKAPHFFDSYFVQVRRKIDFGAKVQAWLLEIENEMKNEYRFKKLEELIWLVWTSELTVMKGYEQKKEVKPDADSDEECDSEVHSESD